ncbi:AMP-dependent synthetase/ligase [Penaeicola halotolerans]|uniref:AMP-dependent synthetase/ligase n=1 Tax=Penaeicola halotolerans TaxID=2793196 RepID=UPI001CF803F9|nr:long-chain fatty acid--CoA ligase [Penaeicola halotolerans]
MEITRVFDLIDYQLRTYKLKDALAYKVDGEWKQYSSKMLLEYTRNVGLGLLAEGIKPGDKIAIISNNRPEWNFVDLGMQQIGVVSVPMYPTITVDDFIYIFEHSETKMVFVGDQELYEKAKEAAASVPTIQKIYTFDEIDGADHWTKLLEKGEESNLADLEAIKENINGEDLLTIIYTSGTTGRPKGVMLSHRNVLSNTMSVSDRLMVEKGKSKALSFLPLCHIYERTGVYFYLYNGVSVYYAESMETIGENLKEVQPHMFNTVPRLLEKVYDKIVAKGYELSGIKKKLFFWALNLGLKYEPNKPQGWWYDRQLKLANKLIFSKWREALGGNVQTINSGASALQPRLARVFWAAQIRVCEGYGLTETSPVVAASVANEEEMRIGMVGKPIMDVEIKIAADGEILVKGPNVMMGYYKQPELTAEVIKDGWFHTGDIGEIQEGVYLKITDRKKEMFKTSGGKYIAPQPMENKFKESLLIEQLMIIGENRNYPVALIVPSFDGLKDWCKIHQIPYTEDEEMIQKPEVINKFQAEVDKYNKYFGKWEQIKRFKVLTHPWGIDTGELTPTLKLKRRVIMDKFGKDIEELYS